MAQTEETKQVVYATDPPFVQRLFSTTEFAWVFLIARLWLGAQWIEAASHKVSDPKWMDTGVALKGFWENAARIPAQGRPPIVFDWYRDFIRFLLDSGVYTWFAKVVAAGELVIGIALILGAFVGIFAFLGAFMNWNFMMAGSASTNPVLFSVALFIVLGWKVAGAWGLDRWLLPALGTPWGPGKLFRQGETPSMGKTQTQGSN